MEIVEPRWSSWSFLVYAGGLTVLGAAAAWLQYLGDHSGDAGDAAWVLLVLVLLAGAAAGLQRAGHAVAAGVFAFTAVVAFVAFLDAVWRLIGWSTSTSSLGGFHPARLLLELLWLAAAVHALRTFRFPLIVAQAAFGGWLLVTDLVSGGGDWSATVSLLVGLAYLAVALSLDGGPRRPYGFWLHVGGGLLIGGSLLWFWHGGNVEWTLIVLASIAYVFFADLVGRSSWAVLGTVGLLAAAAHFALEWTHVQFVFFNAGTQSARGWAAPLVYTCTGVLLAVLGLVIGRRSTARAADAGARGR